MTPARRAGRGRRGPSRDRRGRAARPRATVVKSPGVPHEAAVVAAARERGIEVHRRARARLAAAAEPLHRRDRHQRQDDDGRAARRDPPRGRAAGGGRGQRRARRSRSLVGALDAGGGSSARLELPARGHLGVRARVRGAAEHRARPPRPPRHLRALPRREAAHVREPGPGRRGGRAAGLEVPAAAPGDRFADDIRRRGAAACAARTTSRTPRGRRGRRARHGACAEAAVRARRCATFAGVPHRLEEVASRRRALRQRLEGDQRRLGAARARGVRRRRPR